MRNGQNRTQHKIRRVIFDLNFHNEDVAFKKRRKVESAFNSAIMPALDNVFNTYAGNGQTLWIDQLELDLGLINLESLSMSVVEERIRAQLEGRQWLQDPEIIDDVGNEPRIVSAIITFLRMGYWIWDSPFQRVEALEEEIQGLDERVAHQVRKAILAEMGARSVRLRIMRQFRQKFIEWLISWLTSEEDAKAIRSVSAKVVPDDEAVHRAVLLTLALHVSEYGAGDEERLMQKAIEERDELLSDRAEKRLDFDESSSFRAATMPDSMELKSRALGETFDTSSLPAAFHRSDSELARDTGVEESAFEQGLYVHNAGIVLLHPYLERLFDYLGLLDEHQRFRDFEALYRGVHALHFAATGVATPQEQETILCKLLCGLPISHPIPKHVDLFQNDFNEIERLLQSVIGHWRKLKNTSINVLRESYLQREGKLLKENGAWRLIVEQRSLDVLLAYLPWTVSKVYLPWMDAALMVDWM